MIRPITASRETCSTVTRRISLYKPASCIELPTDRLDKDVKIWWRMRHSLVVPSKRCASVQTWHFKPRLLLEKQWSSHAKQPMPCARCAGRRTACLPLATPFQAAMLKVWMKPAESAATRCVWAGSTHTVVRLSWLTFTSASSCTSFTFHSRRQPSALTAANTYGSRLPRKTTCNHQGLCCN